MLKSFFSNWELNCKIYKTEIRNSSKRMRIKIEIVEDVNSAASQREFCFLSWWLFQADYLRNISRSVCNMFMFQQIYAQHSRDSYLIL